MGCIRTPPLAITHLGLEKLTQMALQHELEHTLEEEVRGEKHVAKNGMSRLTHSLVYLMAILHDVQLADKRTNRCMIWLIGDKLKSRLVTQGVPAGPGTGPHGG